MSKEQDRKFINTFAIVIGILVGITLIIFITANVIYERAKADDRQDPLAEAQVVERIEPPGEVAVAGADTGAGNGAGAVQVSADGGDDLGKQTFERACFACHGTGAAGAPMIGDADDWGTRLEQGREVLDRHSLEGFTGDKGFMPAKGGQTQLSDEAVLAALEYMLEQSQ